MFALGPDNQPLAGTRVTDTIAGGYTQIPQKFYHPNASRNALGLFGGNDVSVASGNLVDVESDLRGTTRDLSNCPSRKFQSSAACSPATNEPLNGHSLQLAPIQGGCPPQQIVFTDRATGKVRAVSTAPRHLPTTQYVSYPGVPAPEALVQQVHGYPWRF